MKIQDACARQIARVGRTLGTSLYKYNGICPGDIRHFIQQEYVEEILEYAKLYWYLNLKDSDDGAIKVGQIAKDWQTFEDEYAVTMMTLWYKACDVEFDDDVCYSKYFEDVCKAYEEHEEEQTIEHNHANAEMAEEIAAYESLLAEEGELPWKTDNDIAFETYKEMCRVDKIRQLAISAYNKGINTLTVIRFMREKLANDAERGIFLEQYASASFWDGFDIDSDY